MITRIGYNQLKGQPYKKPCRVATDSNISNLNSGSPDIIDDISLIVGDRVLVKDQNTSSQNGIYVVNSVGTGSNGSWSRDTDLSSSEDLVSGFQVFIIEGAQNGGKVFYLESIGNLIIDSSNLEFGLISDDNSFLDFYHKYTVFVDPNGDDETGEFGNQRKPFATPEGALIAANQFVEDNTDMFILPQGFSTTYEIEDENYNVLIYDRTRINIHVFAGFYTSVSQNDTPYVNLMENFIDWYFEPGAILVNYGFYDSGFLSGVSPKNTICNVFGEGVFIGLDELFVPIYLEREKSILNFNCSISNLRVYMDNGKINYFVKKILANLTEFKQNYFFGIGNGILSIKSEEFRWIGKQNSNIFVADSCLFVEGGIIDVDINRYTGIDLEEEMLSNFPFTNTENYDFIWNVYDFEKEDFAPPLIGYMYQRLADVSTKVNLRVDFAKVGTYALQTEGGELNFYPGEIILGDSVFVDNTNASYFAFVGGPYVTNTETKFNLIDGKIIMVSRGVNTSIYHESIEIYDDPKVYIKETKFVYEYEAIEDELSVNDTTYGIAIYNGTPTIIVDGPIFYKLSDENIFDSGVFYTTGVTGSQNIKIYSTGFSNIQLLATESDRTLNNLITGTDFIIDEDIEII
jgi:hypothetical protein